MLERVSPGQPLRTSPFRKAHVVNEVLDAAQYVNRTILGKPVGGNGLANPTDIVTVKNLTGGTAKEGDCVQLGNPLLTSTPQRRFPLFEGNQVAAPLDRKYALLMEPLAENGFGKAQIAGICLANVDFSDTTHEFASPQVGSANLASDFGGQFEILMTPSATGVQLVFVRFVVDRLFRLAKVHGSPIAAGGSGDAELQDNTWTGLGQIITVNDPRTTGASLAVGHRIYVRRVAELWWLIDADPCAS